MNRHLANAIVLVGILAFCPLYGQKTSTWEGNGSDPNWTTTENWDTSEDPNGNDTAIVPSPFDITLDANRSVGQLDLRGQTGNFIGISGSAQLTVQNELLWKDSVLNGAGTLISSTNSNFQGVTTFNGWSVTLSGTTTVQTGIMASSGSVNLGGTINWGEAGLTGPAGHFTISGTFTKNTASASHSSLFDPGSLTISGTLAAEKGIIVLQPTAFNPTGGTFATGTEGRIRFQADTVTYTNTEFLNNNEMDITDNVLATEDSIGFAGSIQSTGTNPVVLGTNGKYRSDNASFSGPWHMRGARLKGMLTTTGGGFNWSNGDLGPSVTHTGTASGDFIISSGGVPATRLLGSFTNQGHVTQLRTISVNDDGSGATLTSGLITLEAPSIWELVGFAGLNVGIQTGEEPPLLLIESGGTLAHTGTSSSDRSEVGLSTTLNTGGTIRNDAGTLVMAGLLNLFNGFFNANNADDLGAVIKLDGISLLNASVGLTNGGIFELSENSPGTFLRKLTAAGTGEVILEDGTLVIEPRAADSAATISIGGPDEDGLGDGGVIMRIRSKSGAPNYAIAFDPANTSSGLYSILNVSGPVEWTGRSIGIPLETGDPAPADNSRGELNIAQDGSLSIPSGAPSMNDVKLTNSGTVQHGVGGSSPSITVRRARIVNQGEWRIDGNGNISSPEGSASVVLENSANGIVHKSSGTGTSSLPVTVDNSGTVKCSSGVLDVSGPLIGYDPTTKTITKGRWLATDGGSIRFSSIASVEILEGPLPDTLSMAPPSEPTIEQLLEMSKMEISSSNGGLPPAESQILNASDVALYAQAQLTLRGNARLEVKGDSELEIGGDLEVRESAVLVGDGHYIADNIKIDTDSWISPGNSPGTLTLTGNFEMLQGSRYFFEASSSSAYDQIVVNGNVTLSGFFVPDFLDGYTPSVGTSFTVITADSISGTFQGQILGYLESNIAFDFVNTGTELIATVISASPADFNTWQAQNFFPVELAESSVSGLNADPEKDGISNFWEFISGTRARKADRLPWSFNNVVAPDGTAPASVDVSFRWRAGLVGLDFVVERTSDLESSWAPSSSVQILSDVTVDGIREITLRASGADENALKEFFRLSAEEAGI